MDENNDPIKNNDSVKEINVNINTGATAEQQSTEVKKQNSMGLVGFIFSLVGLLIAAIPCGVVALITSIIGLVKFDDSKEKGKGLAIAGIVIGAVDIVAGIINIAMSIV